MDDDCTHSAARVAVTSGSSLDNSRLKGGALMEPTFVYILIYGERKNAVVIGVYADRKGAEVRIVNDVLGGSKLAGVSIEEHELW